MSDTQRADFELEGRPYKFPSSFRLGDPVLVTELTGMDFEDFSARIADVDALTNPVILIGMIGVAVWQANPTWTRAKVLRYVQGVSIEQFTATEDDSAVGSVEVANVVPPEVPAATPEPVDFSPES